MKENDFTIEFNCTKWSEVSIFKKVPFFIKSFFNDILKKEERPL
jgi:hypothetical protein